MGLSPLTQPPDTLWLWPAWNSISPGQAVLGLLALALVAEGIERGVSRRNRWDCVHMIPGAAVCALYALADRHSYFGIVLADVDLVRVQLTWVGLGLALAAYAASRRFGTGRLLVLLVATFMLAMLVRNLASSYSYEGLWGREVV